MQMSRTGRRPFPHSLPHMITMFETLHQSGVQRPLLPVSTRLCPSQTPPHVQRQALSFGSQSTVRVARSLSSSVTWQTPQHLSGPQLLALLTLTLLIFPTCLVKPPLTSGPVGGCSRKLWGITAAPPAPTQVPHSHSFIPDLSLSTEPTADQKTLPGRFLRSSSHDAFPRKH